MKIKIIRTGASSQLITFEQLGSASSLFTPLSGYFETTEDLTTDLDIFTQATAASNNDVIQKLFTVKYIPGN